MLFDKTKKAISEFIARDEAATTAFENAKQEIKQTFATELALKKIDEAKAIYDSSILEAQSEAQKAILENFAEVSDNLNSVVTSAPDSALMALVNAAHVAGNNLTAAEAEAYFNKVYSNYPATVALISVFEKNGIVDNNGNGFLANRIDSISEDLNRMKNEALSAIHNGFPASYTARVLTAEGEKNPLLRMSEDVVQPFIDRT